MSKNVESDLNMNGVSQVINLPTPVLGGDAVNKDYVDNNLFSIKRIAPGRNIRIPVDQQMIVRQSFVLEGSLDLSGELVII